MVRRNLYDYHANKKWQKCLKRLSIFLKRFVRENKQRPCKLQIYNTRFSWKTHARQTVYYKCTHIQILYFIYVQRLTRKNSPSTTDFHCLAKSRRGGGGRQNRKWKCVKNYESYDVGCVMRTAIWISLVWEYCSFYNQSIFIASTNKTTNALSSFSFRTIECNVVDVFRDEIIFSICVCIRLGKLTGKIEYYKIQKMRKQ